MLLSAIVLMPLLFALIITFWPKEGSIRHLAFGFAIIEFLMSLTILQKFDAQSSALQLVERYTWIERFGISYFLGIDGISLWLVGRRHLVQHEFRCDGIGRGCSACL